MSGTVNLHRVIKAPVNRVFRAFSDPDALASWLPPYGFIAKVHSFEFKEGGRFQMSFKNFTNGQEHSFGGTYSLIKENETLVYGDKFDDPKLPGEMKNTVTFKEVMGGTEIRIVQEGIPEMIPLEMCYLGWQDSLQKLKLLVEPEINQ